MSNKYFTCLRIIILQFLKCDKFLYKFLEICFQLGGAMVWLEMESGKGEIQLAAERIRLALREDVSVRPVFLCRP